ALGPALGGWLIGMGSLIWPFIAAASLQFGYVILFPALMGRYDPGRQHRAAEVQAKGPDRLSDRHR
ncbi:MAG: hypothetical protein M1294_13280, partial [Firmicutes bacterium]|nr:hypothetical protein [Bacillota bacterium]